MNKTALAIRMLEMLYGGGKKSRKDIAEVLEISERKVLDLKQELEIAGYHIISTTGKNGGYELDSNHILPVMNLTIKEKTALNHASMYLKDKKDFIYQTEMKRVVEKMHLVSNTAFQATSIVYKKDGSIAYHMLDDMQKIEYCIQNQYRIALEYISLNATHKQTYIVEPYWILNDESAYYLVGYVPSKQDYRTFKLVQQRVKGIQYLSERFYKLDTSLKDVIGKLNLVKEELIDVVFHVYGKQARLFYEKTIGMNDRKQWINSTTLEISTTVEGTQKIKALILSLGDQGLLISPESLKKECIDTLKIMLEQYDNVTFH